MRTSTITTNTATIPAPAPDAPHAAQRQVALDALYPLWKAKYRKTASIADPVKRTARRVELARQWRQLSGQAGALP